jgi:hypothetical protein
VGGELVHEDIQRGTDGWTDIKKPIVALRITANMPINKKRRPGKYTFLKSKVGREVNFLTLCREYPRDQEIKNNFRSSRIIWPNNTRGIFHSVT